MNVGRENLPKGKLQREEKLGWTLGFRCLLEGTRQEQGEADAQTDSAVCQFIYLRSIYQCLFENVKKDLVFQGEVEDELSGITEGLEKQKEVFR